MGIASICSPCSPYHEDETSTGSCCLTRVQNQCGPLGERGGFKLRALQGAVHTTGLPPAHRNLNEPSARGHRRVTSYKYLRITAAAMFDYNNADDLSLHQTTLVVCVVLCCLNPIMSVCSGMVMRRRSSVYFF